MTAANKTLIIEQGATFALGFNWYHESLTVPGTPGVAYDLTGCVARMQIRRLPNSDILVSAASSGASPMIVLGTTNGRIDVKLTPTATNGLVVDRAMYDLEIQMAGGDIYKVLSGHITVVPNVTHS